MKVIKTISDKETIALGVKLGQIVKDINAVILLDGDLAAGKTTFTKGIAKGMGINEIVNSPTFTIMKQYTNEYGKSLYHLDLYRLNEMGMDYDLEEYVDDLNSVVVIEWPFQVEELLPKEHIYIKIEGLNDNRTFNINYNGMKYKKVVDLL